MQQSRGRKRQISLFPVAAAFHHHRSSPPSASRGRRNRRRGGRNVDSSRGRANTRGRRCREEHVFYSTFCLERERDKIPNQNFLFSRFFRSPPARLCASGTYYSVVYTNDSLRSVAFYYLLMRVTCKENKRKSKALRSGVFFFPFVFFLSSLFSLSLSMRKDLSKRDLSTLDDVSF